MEKDIFIFFNTVYGIQSVKGHFGIVFQGQSNIEALYIFFGLITHILIIMWESTLDLGEIEYPI